jgi:hypothetical protein
MKPIPVDLQRAGTKGVCPDCLSHSLELITLRPRKRQVIQWRECPCGWSERAVVQYELDAYLEQQEFAFILEAAIPALPAGSKQPAP